MRGVDVFVCHTTLAQGGGSSCINSNGGFEMPAIGGGVATLGMDSSLPLPGWTVGQVDVVSGWWICAEGTQALDLFGYVAGGVTAMVETVVGQSYTLSYALSINTERNPTTNRSFMALWDGVVIDSNDVLFDPARDLATNPLWVNRTRTVVATSMSSNITYYTSELDCLAGPVLDAVWSSRPTLRLRPTKRSSRSLT
jgi:hypothetical protein